MTAPMRWLGLAFGFALLASLLACVGGGVAYEGGGYGVDYYEPSGYVYGDWGPGYNVGPFRHGDHRPASRPAPGPASRPRPYHPAAAGRSMPSIPSRRR
jgi:hypothetical protein